MCCIILQQVCVDSLFCDVCDVALFDVFPDMCMGSDQQVDQGSERGGGGGAGQTQGDREWVKWLH